MVYHGLLGKRFHFLVTGGAGFIGSNIALKLLELGQVVTVLDNFLTGKRENIEDIERFIRTLDVGQENFRFIQGDIRVLDACMEASEGVDFILHNAALGSVPRSIKDPVASTGVNVIGTVNMLMAAKEKKARRFIYASSSSVYGDSQKLPKVEGQEGRPLSPYAVGKLAGEIYAENFWDVYGMETIGLRYFNVFGPRQDADSPYAAVIPIFIKKLLNDEAPTINGDGSTTRDFTYVENVVQANIAAVFADKKAAGKVYNIASSRGVSLMELYDNVARLLNKKIKPLYGPERKGDIRHSLADITRARSYLGFSPTVDFEKGLSLSIEWYKGNV